MLLHTQQQTIMFIYSVFLYFHSLYIADEISSGSACLPNSEKGQLKGEKGEEWWSHKCVHLLSVILRETTHVIQGSHSQRGALPRRSSAAVFVCCVRPFAAIAWTSPTVPFYMRNGPYAQSCVVLVPDSRLERLHDIR